MPLTFSRVLGALVLALGSPGCFLSPCDFTARCTAPGQYERCFVGGDERAQVLQITCPALNAACVEPEANEARCVYAPATACDASFVDRCEGSQRIYCDERLGWAQAVDCGVLASGGCHIDAPSGKAVCD